MEVATQELPDLSGFTAHYGVRVTFVGDEGDYAVMLGHVEPRRALAALNRCTRVDLGWKLANEGFGPADELMTNFEHRWAILRTQCEAYPNCVNTIEHRGARVCLRCHEIQSGDWWLDWDDEVAAATPTAFPVTVLDM